MGMRILTVMAAAAVLVMSTACQLQQQQNPASEDKTEKQEHKILPPMHLGAVHQVYPEQKFALLRIIGPMPRGGTVLITHPADGSNIRIGNLVVSSDFNARGNIIAADIRSGEVMQGDRVFQYRNISKTEEDEDSPEARRNAYRPIFDSVTPEEVAAARLQEGEPVSNTPTATEEDAIPETPFQDSPEPHTPEPPTSNPAVDVPSYLDEIPDDIHDWE